MPEKRQSEIAKEISYEWKMLCWTHETLHEEIGEEVAGDEDTPFLAVKSFFGTSMTSEENIEGSALLESFLLHVRNLRDFLFRDSSNHKDDVLAVDYFILQEDWRKIRPPMGKYLNGLRERINKALAHISYTRLDYRMDKLWNVEQIKNDLTLPWNAFLNAIPPEKRQWFPIGSGGDGNGAGSL